MKQKLTLNQQLWNKEMRRIKQFMRRAEKRGYIFEIELPERPSRVTKKSIDFMRSIRPDTLYSHSYKVVDRDSGEVISGLEARQQERHMAAVKAAATRRANRLKFATPDEVATSARLDDIAINNVRSLIREIFASPTISGRYDFYNGDKWVGRIEAQNYVSEMESILDRAIAERGKASVADSLREHESELSDLMDKLPNLKYHDEFIDSNNKFAVMLKGSPLSLTERENLERDYESQGAGWEEPE